MSASKEILAMMHAVAEGRVQPEEATQSVARFVVEMHDADRFTMANYVAGFALESPSPIGPLHGAGWNDAIKHVVKSIRALPNGRPASGGEHG